MTTTSDFRIKEEMLVFLRNSDVFSIAVRGVTTQTDTFDATAGQTVFTLTKNKARNIRSVTVQAAAKAVYRDYTPAYADTNSTVTLGTASTIHDAVVVVYDYSSGTIEKIFPDFPDIKFLSTDCPRIGFGIVRRTKPIGIGAVNWMSDALAVIKVYDLGTYKTIDDYLALLRQAIKNSQKSFYHFQLVTPESDTEPGIAVDGKPKVFERSLNIVLRFGYES